MIRLHERKRKRNIGSSEWKMIDERQERKRRGRSGKVDDRQGRLVSKRVCDWRLRRGRWNGWSGESSLRAKLEITAA